MSGLPVITIEGGRIVEQRGAFEIPMRPGVMESVSVSLPILHGTYALVAVADGQTPTAEERVEWRHCQQHSRLPRYEMPFPPCWDCVAERVIAVRGVEELTATTDRTTTDLTATPDTVRGVGETP